jgi:hypothetical protein
MKQNSKQINLKIQKIEVTNDNLTSRAGLNFFVKYLEQIKIYSIALMLLKFVKKSSKGYTIKNIFKQLILYFVEGTYNSISGFDVLKKDKSYSSIIETPEKEMCTSSAITRFFRKFNYNLTWFLEQILIELFIWRLKVKQPKIIELFMDTCVMKNESCSKKEGVSWTYKNAMGFQPLNIIWNGLPIRTVLKAGKRHSLSEKTAKKQIAKIIKIIRKRYSKDIPIIIKMDTGFFDNNLLDRIDELNAYFICVAPMSPTVTKCLENITPTLSFKKYKNEKNLYNYSEFGYKCLSWKKFHRVIYTELKMSNNQYLLKGFRDRTLLITNLKETPETKKTEELQEYLKAEKIIELNHMRGKDELTHRGIKDFGTEKLPFQKFNHNAAFYYIMIISFFLFECFKKDVLKEIIPLNSYATTIRRKIIDIAGKIIKTSGIYILKISEAAYNFLNPSHILKNLKKVTPLQI